MPFNSLSCNILENIIVFYIKMHLCIFRIIVIFTFCLLIGIRKFGAKQIKLLKMYFISLGLISVPTNWLQTTVHSRCSCLLVLGEACAALFITAHAVRHQRVCACVCVCVQLWVRVWAVKIITAAAFSLSIEKPNLPNLKFSILNVPLPLPLKFL